MPEATLISAAAVLVPITFLGLAMTLGALALHLQHRDKDDKRRFEECNERPSDDRELKAYPVKSLEFRTWPRWRKLP